MYIWHVTLHLSGYSNQGVEKGHFMCLSCTRSNVITTMKYKANGKYQITLRPEQKKK